MAAPKQSNASPPSGSGQQPSSADVLNILSDAPTSDIARRAHVSTNPALVNTGSTACDRGSGGSDDHDSLDASSSVHATSATKLIPRHRVASAPGLQQRMLNAGETVTSGAVHSSIEAIERRRSKVTVSQAEFEVGMTERLLPEIRRLTALHEVNYGDAVVREVDPSAYFRRTTAGCSGGDRGEVVSCGIVDEDHEDDAAAFAAFEAAMPSSAADGVPNPSGVRPSPTIDEEHPPGDIDASQQAALTLAPAGQQTPWFVDLAMPGGVARWRPVPARDCARLLLFLLRLRGQAVADLPRQLRRKLQLAQKSTGSNGTAETKGGTEKKRNTSRGGKTRRLDSDGELSMADIITYLDTAPSPLMGFTEDLHPREAVRTPALLFTLTIENASLQNIVGHLAALFEIPEKAFASHSPAIKMSCTTFLCAVEPNRLRAEHLLLLNTMRHPGFVIRVSNICEVPDDMMVVGKDGKQVPAADDIVGALARWQPLYEVELILRRVQCKTRHDLEHRLSAVKEVGAIFFAANREANLVRTAKDILHGFYKSAMLSALSQRKPPLAMKHFLSRPNVITASRARRVSTDATIRQILKVFITTKGDWSETLGRTPYVLRRRWINALRGSVWNAMASRRLRTGGRQVMVGDAVVKEVFRADAHRRMIPTLKCEHVKIVETPEEASRCSLEDVVIPYLRGRYPSEYFAPESTAHPIMTEANMLAFLREAHAPQLLLGLAPEHKRLLDIRCDIAPLLWRRLLVRPVAMEYTILEDKAPVKTTHFDASRLLRSDRWDVESTRVTATKAGDGTGDAAPQVAFPTAAPSLMPQSEVLERTTIGARLSHGMLAEDFFTIPASEDYVVLGQAKRLLEGQFVTAAPHTPSRELGDRVFSAHIRAVTNRGVGGLTLALREYFALVGIEREVDSALQHKVHRMRRELDPETPLLTAPSFCAACYNRDHDTPEACAEYLFKQSRRSHQLWQARTLTGDGRHGDEERSAPQRGHSSAGALLSDARDTERRTHALTIPSSTAAHPSRLRLRLTLRRRSEEDKWGVRMTKTLRLTGIDDVSIIVAGDVHALSPSAGAHPSLLEQMPNDKQVPAWPPHLLSALRRLHHASTSPGHRSMPPREMGHTATLAAFLHQLSSSTDFFVGDTAIHAVAFSSEASDVLMPLFSPKGSATPDGGCPQAPATNEFLRRCAWRLAAVEETPVDDRRAVAAAFVRRAKAREVTLFFETSLSDVPAPADDHRDVDPMTTAAVTLAESRLTLAQAQAVMASASPAAQRWLRDLPDVLTMVLAKHRRDVCRHPSWGLRIEASDMTLLSYGTLLQHYVRRGHTSSEGEEVVNPFDRTVVSGFTPPESFLLTSPGASAAAEGLSEAMLQELQPLLRQLYVVTHVQDTSVANRAEVVRVFRAHVEADGNSGGVAKNADAATVRLSLRLKRQAESYRWLSAASAVPQLKERDASTVERASNDAAQRLVTVGEEVALDDVLGQEDLVPSPYTCPPLSSAVTVLNPAQQSQQHVTIAINRRVVNSATEGRWGIRVQRGTCRLKHLQHNRLYTFQVFASKRQRAIRITDTLRLHSKGDVVVGSSHGRAATGPFGGGEATSDNGSHSRRSDVVESQFRSYFVYMLRAVNHAPVSDYDTLRQTLTRAATPPPHAAAGSVTAPESVTLQVRQYALARLHVTVRRGGPGEPSAMTSIGLGLDSSLCVTHIEPGTAMATGVHAAASGVCSLRRLLRCPHSGGAATPERQQQEEDQAKALIALPVLAAAFVDVVASLPTGWGRSRCALYRCESTAKVTASRRRRYDVDDDEAAAADADSTLDGGTAPSTSTRQRHALNRMVRALENLRTVSAGVVSECDRMALVDGLHLLQASLVASYAAIEHRRLTAYLHSPPSESTESSEAHHASDALQAATEAALDALEQQLQDAHQQVKWCLVYAMQSGTSLRTLADVQRVVAPGVAEETLVLQQFLAE